MDPAELVREFHRAAGFDLPSHPTLDVSSDLRALRLRLIEEELAELRAALDDDDLVETADALADLLYVVYGAAVSFGIPIERVFAEVHRANMAKLTTDEVVEREDGKVLKPPAWTPPEVERVLGGDVQAG
jgi:predicted HAD superfamily Cof-like phosphohydrolase